MIIDNRPGASTMLAANVDIESWMRISANVTGVFGNVTDLGRVLSCAGLIVEMESI